MHYHFVVNPAAGRRTAVPLARAVCAGLEAAGARTSMHVTSQAGCARDHVAALADGAADRLVVVGGDGTLHEVVNAERGSLPWPIGVVPMGTANLVGRELRMPLNRRAGALAKRLAAAEPWAVDVMRIRHADGSEAYAVANVGVGLDAEIVHAISDVRRGASGSGGYARWIGPILECLRGFRFPRLRVTVDGRRSFAAAACIVQNAHNYGGVFRLSPAAALDSGALDVALIRARTQRDLLRILAGMLLRRVPHFGDVRLVRAQQVLIECAEHVHLQADGDPAGLTDVRIDLLRGRLQLLRA